MAVPTSYNTTLAPGLVMTRLGINNDWLLASTSFRASEMTLVKNFLSVHLMYSLKMYFFSLFKSQPREYLFGQVPGFYSTGVPDLQIFSN